MKETKRFSFAILRGVVQSFSVVLLMLGTLSLAQADPSRTAQMIAPQSQLTEDSIEPAILSASDIDLYIRIFEVQEKGQWKKADSLISQLANPILMSYVQFQRYMHPTAYTSKYNELRDWLASYNDHPEANRVYKLALRRKPGNAAQPKRPLSKKYRPEPDRITNPHLSKKKRSSSQRKRVNQINRYAKSLLARERPTQTLNYIQQEDVDRDLTAVETDRIKTWIARQYFLERVPKKALPVAEDVINRSREALPLADWIAALSHWQLRNYESAAVHFEAFANAKYNNSASRSAGAYWAARAHLVTKNPVKVAKYLEIAADEPFTFYGVLANRQLGNDHAYDWSALKLTASGFRAVTEYPSVARAVALTQIGRGDLADAELRRIHGRVSANLDRDLLALAIALDLPAAQLQIAEYSRGDGFEPGLFPLPKYQPADGFELDRALIYAFIRKESKFDPNAKSWAGARGLMQLMPRTASSLAKDNSLRSSNADKLFDPSFNLKLGQDYLQQLLRRGDPSGNLYALAVAYNGGPGNLRKWTKELKTDSSDPLFFIESIPSGETRAFIEQVLTNLWIYRNRLGQSAPTLEAAAGGKWPIYRSVETEQDRYANR